MLPLDYPDRHFLLASEGWLELGDPAESASELRRLSKEGELHPDVLELRWRLYAGKGEWEAALAVSRTLVSAAPERPSGYIHQSYSLHELARTEEAWELLLDTVDRFPKESVIAYNLACYACQLGDLVVARDWLQRAVKIRGKTEIKAMAMQDSDLSLLKGYIEGL